MKKFLCFGKSIEKRVSFVILPSDGEDTAILKTVLDELIDKKENFYWQTKIHASRVIIDNDECEHEVHQYIPLFGIDCTEAVFEKIGANIEWYGRKITDWVAHDSIFKQIETIEED